MLRLIVIASLLSTSCGMAKQEIDRRIDNKITKEEEKNDPRSGCKTASEFYRYIDDFEAEYGNNIGDIPVCIGSIEIEDKESVIGVCRTWTGPTRKYREITIKEEWFDRNHEDEYAVRQLIEHELGHCLLNRDHVEEVDEDFHPISIMYPYHFSGGHYQDNHEYYLNELFRRL